MSADTRSLIARQVRRVRRRLFARRLLSRLSYGLAGAIAATTFWMLVAPFVAREAPAHWRWQVLAACSLAGVTYGILSALRNRPNADQAALSLDAEFGLRERVTTSLTLDEAAASSPAGQAVLADTADRVRDLAVAERFPVRMDRSALLVPSLAAVLGLVALFYDPAIPTAAGNADSPRPLAAAEKKEVDAKFEALAKPKKDPTVEPNRVKSEALKQLEARLEEIARRPRDSTQQLRERIKDMSALEDEVKKLERERGDRTRMILQQLQTKDQLMPNNAANDGPAKDFIKALAEGNLDKGREELEKLAKKVASGEMKDEEKQQLASQMKQLQKQLEDLAQQKSKQDLLKKLGEDGKLDPEALERELAQLSKENENLKDLQKLASQMGQCQQCMKAGDMDGARQALKKASDQMQQMAGDSEELNDLREALQSLQEARESACKACEGGKPGDQGADMREGEGGRSLSDSPNGRSDFGQGAGQGSGRRPDGEQGKIRPFDAKQDGKFNAKGQKQFDGFVPGQAFKKKSGVDLATDIRQAAQEAPEAIETQRIPKAARDMARGYFKNLGGLGEADKKAEKK